MVVKKSLLRDFAFQGGQNMNMGWKEFVPNLTQNLLIVRQLIYTIRFLHQFVLAILSAVLLEKTT